MRFVLTLAMLTGAACASGPSLNDSIRVHNTLRSVVLEADRAYEPIYAEAFKAADASYGHDEVAFKREMQPYNAVVDGLEKAKLLEQSLHLAIDQWQQGLDDGGMTREAAACSSDALDALAAHVAPMSSVLYSAVQVLSLQLAAMADGAECVVAR